MIILKKFITRKFIKSHPNEVFVFGDNDIRKGSGGQAKEMRGEQNSFGVRVKRFPGKDNLSYYTDYTYKENIKKITEDFDIVERHLKGGKDGVIPKDGIGTGLARMKDFAPRTLEYVENKIKELCNKYGVKQED